jgi:phosphoribosylformylglycinamidine synthase PurS subunit
MKFRAKIEVTLKPGHSDPEGETTKQSLTELHFPVRSVSVSKVYKIELNSESLTQARRTLDEMCRRLLANPVKDDYFFKIEEV